MGTPSLEPGRTALALLVGEWPAAWVPVGKQLFVEQLERDVKE